MAEKFDAEVLEQRTKPDLDDDIDKPFNYMAGLAKDRPTGDRPAAPAASSPGSEPPEGRRDSSPGGAIDSYVGKYLAKEDEKITITTRMYKRRRQQIEDEMRATGLEIWQLIDVGLELYFRQKHDKGNK